jgi:LacI family fructose operon transcriptional repressor
MRHGVAHVNVDLPGTKASSVISDNYWGAYQLTNKLIEISTPLRSANRNKAYFVGGVASDFATQRRIDGFRAALVSKDGDFETRQVDACGYEQNLAEAAVKALYRRLNGLPRALFVNSTIALEGVVSFLTTLPPAELGRCSLGCYDWDPFARVLSFPVLMVRQDVEKLLEAAFDVIDRGSFAEARVIEIKPELMFNY